MTGKQTAVMWLGLLLVAVRLFTTDQWDALWGTVKTGSKPGGVLVGSTASGVTLPGALPVVPGPLRSPSNPAIYTTPNTGQFLA
jgi:hypothetical protein